MDQFWPGACQARFAGPPSAKQLKELVHARILNALHVQHGGLRMMQARWDGWPGSFWKSLGSLNFWFWHANTEGCFEM
eukprot:scaffold310046_cov19-Tisochrysis_lutea.AAC.1